MHEQLSHSHKGVWQPIRKRHVWNLSRHGT